MNDLVADRIQLLLPKWARPSIQLLIGNTNTYDSPQLQANVFQCVSSFLSQKEIAMFMLLSPTSFEVAIEQEDVGGSPRASFVLHRVLAPSRLGRAMLLQFGHGLQRNGAVKLPYLFSDLSSCKEEEEVSMCKNLDGPVPPFSFSIASIDYHREEGGPPRLCRISPETRIEFLLEKQAEEKQEREESFAVQFTQMLKKQLFSCTDDDEHGLVKGLSVASQGKMMQVLLSRFVFPKERKKKENRGDQGSVPNGFCIVGPSGSGKTYFVKNILMETLLQRSSSLSGNEAAKANVVDLEQWGLRIKYIHVPSFFFPLQEDDWGEGTNSISQAALKLRELFSLVNFYSSSPQQDAAGKIQDKAKAEKLEADNEYQIRFLLILDDLSLLSPLCPSSVEETQFKAVSALTHELLYQLERLSRCPQCPMTVITTVSKEEFVHPSLLSPTGLGPLIFLHAVLSMPDRMALLKQRFGDAIVGEESGSNVVKKVTGEKKGFLEELCHVTKSTTFSLQQNQKHGNATAIASSCTAADICKGIEYPLLLSEFVLRKEAETDDASEQKKDKIREEKEQLSASPQHDSPVAFEGIFGMEEHIQTIQDVLLEPLLHQEVVDAVGLTCPKGALIYGATGVGKTLLLRCIAEHLANIAPFLVKVRHVDAHTLVTKEVGESEKNIERMFHSARAAHPCVLMIDNLDAIAPPRNRERTESSSNVADRMLSTLLAEMDGIQRHHGQTVIIVASAQNLSTLDPAVYRSGRLDLHLQLLEPNFSDLSRYLSFCLRNSLMDLLLERKTIVEKHPSSSTPKLSTNQEEEILFVDRVLENLTKTHLHQGMSFAHVKGVCTEFVSGLSDVFSQEFSTDALKEAILNAMKVKINLN